MKVFWWQGGLHFEPEGEFDNKKLAKMADDYCVSKRSPATMGPGQCDGSQGDFMDIIMGRVGRREENERG